MGLARCLYIMAITTALALAVAWQSTLIRAGGYRLERLRREVRRAQSHARMYRAQIGKLKSPGRIVHLVRELELDLVAAAEPDRTRRAVREGGAISESAGRTVLRAAQ